MEELSEVLDEYAAAASAATMDELSNTLDAYAADVHARWADAGDRELTPLESLWADEEVWTLEMRQELDEHRGEVSLCILLADIADKLGQSIGIYERVTPRRLLGWFDRNCGLAWRQRYGGGYDQEDENAYYAETCARIKHLISPAAEQALAHTITTHIAHVRAVCVGLA